MANPACRKELAESTSPGMLADLTMLARWTSLGACAGGLAGLVVGGIGGRLAMLLLRFTSPDFIRGLESDDGFIMGRFTFSNTLSLLLVTTVLGSIGGLFVVLGRPFLPARYVLLGWPLAAGTIVGAIIVKSDGVDFNLLDPKVLAIAMFVAIPAAGAFLIVWLIQRWERWWWTDWKRTTVATLPGLPSIVAFPIWIVAAVVMVIWVAVLRFEGLRTLHETRPVRVLAVSVFGLLTALGTFSLGNDIREIL